MMAKLKQGCRTVSIDRDGNLVFWAITQFDIIVSAEDVVDCKFVNSGIRGAYSAGSKDGVWYGPVFELTFANGSTGCLVINEFSVEDVEYRDSDIANIPKVDGWLSPDGRRDEHYNDTFCPNGYKPNILGYYKQISKHGQLSRIDNALKLSKRFPEIFGVDGTPNDLYIFDGTKNTYYIKNIKK